jgi:hypothetical protein
MMTELHAPNYTFIIKVGVTSDFVIIVLAHHAGDVFALN